MFWLVILATILLGAVVATVVVVRGAGRRRHAEGPRVVVSPRAALAAPEALAPGDAKGDQTTRLRASVKRRRDQAERLTAGHVQLIDVGAMVEGGATGGLSPARALSVAEEVARAMTGPGDILVRMDPDGLAILFDGLDRERAAAQSRRIADATMVALGEVGAGGQFLAEGFAYELDDVLEGAVIDTVEDLVRFVHIAHRTYVAKQRGVARQLEQGLSLMCRPVTGGRGGEAIALEIAVFRRHGEGGRVSMRDDGFASVDPALGAETDCVVLEKVPAAVALKADAASPGLPIYVPVRLTTVVNPLYLDNLNAALDALPAAIRQRLVPVVDPAGPGKRGMVPRVRDLLRPRVAAIAIRVVDLDADVAAAAAAGIATVVLDGPDGRFDKPAEAVARFRQLARDAGLSPVVLGAADSVSRLPGGIAHSRAQQV